MSLNLDREFFLDHYTHPRNNEVLPHPHAKAEDINPLCGDRVEIGVQIADDHIAAIYFQGRGCAVSQASASILTEMVEGKSVQDVREMSEDDFLDALGIPISPARSNCAFLSLRILHRCLGQYEQSSERRVVDDANARTRTGAGKATDDAGR
jgi:nitrogen fixation protein NifU and related proteins